MSTASVRRRCWTRSDYDRVVESGGFGPEDHIELLDGEIWEMAPQGTPHAAVCSRIIWVLKQAFGDACCVRSQAPFSLDDVSEPEPDLAVVRGSDFDYLEDHPREALLLVLTRDDEVSPLHAPTASIPVSELLPA